MKPSDTLASNAHDQAIDATLTALREAALPPAGLEQRVLQNLAEQTASTPRASWRLAWITVPAALCAVLALIAIPVVRHPQKAPMPVANDAPSSPGLVPVSSPKPPDQLLVGKAPNSHPRPPRVRRIAIVRENPVAAARGNTPPPPAHSQSRNGCCFRLRFPVIPLNAPCSTPKFSLARSPRATPSSAPFSRNPKVPQPQIPNPLAISGDYL